MQISRGPELITVRLEQKTGRLFCSIIPTMFSRGRVAPSSSPAPPGPYPDLAQGHSFQESLAALGWDPQEASQQARSKQASLRG